MNKIPQQRKQRRQRRPSRPSWQRAGPVWAPPAGLAGAPLPSLLPLLWCFIHSCSLPHAIHYHFIFYFINRSTFILYHCWWVVVVVVRQVVVGGGQWWLGGRPLETTGDHRCKFPRTDFCPVLQIQSSNNAAALVRGKTNILIYK